MALQEINIKVVFSAEFMQSQTFTVIFKYINYKENSWFTQSPIKDSCIIYFQIIIEKKQLIVSWRHHIVTLQFDITMIRSIVFATSQSD